MSPKFEFLRRVKAIIVSGRYATRQGTYKLVTLVYIVVIPKFGWAGRGMYPMRLRDFRGLAPDSVVRGLPPAPARLLKRHGDSQTVVFLLPKLRPAIFTTGKFCAMSLAQLQHLLINTLSTDYRRLLNSSSLLRRNGRRLLDTLIEVCASWAQ